MQDTKAVVEEMVPSSNITSSAESEASSHTLWKMDVHVNPSGGSAAIMSCSISLA